MNNCVCIYCLILYTIPIFGQIRELPVPNNSLIDSHSELGVKLSNWSIGVYPFLGYETFTKELETNFNNHFIFGLDANLEFKKIITLHVGFNTGLRKNKADIPFEDFVWLKKYKARVSNLESTLGIKVLDLTHLNFVPFTGIASTTIAPQKQSPYNAQYDLDWPKNISYDTTSFLVGSYFDFKLPEKKPTGRNSVGNLWSYEAAIRLKYSYYIPNFNNKYAELNGDLHQITVGIAASSRKINVDNIKN